MEAKHGKASLGKRRARDDGDDESNGSEESSSEDEEEDENAELVTDTLDAEISATLNAIRSKDPRVYDKNVTFYSNVDESAGTDSGKKKEKPMFLQDYHRENLMKGIDPAEEDAKEEPPKTFAEEQEELKKGVVKEMHAAAEGNGDNEDEDMDDDGDFLVRKQTQEPTPAPKPEIKLDVENADKDPEKFLSNFMSSKAWAQTGQSGLQPFESDDEEEENRAEAFEEAYNLRFEDPNKINETLITHARDASNKYSVRREEKSNRKKHREAERMRKEEEKKEREHEKNRLRKLKADELQEKVKQIKEVAGLRASKFTDEDWARFLDEAWDDKKFEEEMQKRFGEEYYAEDEAEESDGEGKGKRKKPKKPTWDDDIDIKDLVPDFDEGEKPDISQLNTEENENEDANDDEAAEGETKKSKAQEKREQKRENRKEKLRIEEAIDRNLDLDISLLPGATKKNSTRFRYRETSPQAYGLTARDILMADDSQLNQYAGLKKLASFRDPEKKQRDQKKLGKKARLRKWRQDTFGREDAPDFNFGSEKAAAAHDKDDEGEAKVDIREGEPKKKKRKRSKKH